MRLNVSPVAGGWTPDHPVLQPAPTRRRVRGVGHRHRHPAREAADHLRSVPAGRRRARAASTAAPASAWRSAASWRACSAARSSCAARPDVGSTFTLTCRCATSARRSSCASASARRAGAALAAVPRCARRARRSSRSPTIATRSSSRRRDAARSSRTTRTTRASCVDLRARQRLQGAASPRAAPRRWRWRASSSPTAISLDVFLPDMLGWTVLSQLKQDPAHAPHPGADRHARRGPPARPRARRVRLRDQADDDRRPRRRARRASRTYAAPRRKRLLVVEDNAAEQLEHPRAARPRRHRHHRRVDTGERGARRRSARSDVRLRRARPAAARHVRLRGARAAWPATTRCATCRSSSSPAASSRPRRTRGCTTLARSVVVKGVESPERLLDETALFLHRVVADLPREKQEMLERLHRSDEDLVGQTVLVVDDDVRNIFALSSVLERRGMKVARRRRPAARRSRRSSARRTSRSC